MPLLLPELEPEAPPPAIVVTVQLPLVGAIFRIELLPRSAM